jgi:hypothetical protein
MPTNLYLFGAAALAGLMSQSLPTNADVIWTFTETACRPLNGDGCAGISLPLEVATLQLPSVNSSGHYMFHDFPPPEIETGDTDFLFRWTSINYSAPVSVFNACRPGPCDWDLSFASSPDDLTISVDFQAVVPKSSNIFLQTNGGFIGSDSIMPGCGMFSECIIAGIWTLAAVPEPPGIWSVLCAAALLAAARVRRRALGRSAFFRKGKR